MWEFATDLRMRLGLPISLTIKAPYKVKPWPDTSQGSLSDREARQSRQASESDNGESGRTKGLTDEDSELI